MNPVINNLQFYKSGKIIKLLNNNDQLKIFTTPLYLPFGLGKKNSYNNTTEYFLDCFVSTNNEEYETFITYIDSLETEIKNIIKTQYKTLDNKLTSEPGYYPILRPNKNYPKILKINFKRDNQGNFLTMLYDENKNKIKLTENNISDIFTKNTSFKCLIECSKMWLFNNQVGSYWHIAQIKLENDKDQSNEQNEPIESNIEQNNIYNTILID